MVKVARRKRRWPKLKFGRPIKRSYDNFTSLHAYEEEIVMREIERAGARVSANELSAKHPDGLRIGYLNKVLTRLYRKDKLTRERHTFMRRSLWKYAIKPPVETGLRRTA